MNDNYLYAKLANFVVNKSDLSEKDIPALADLIGDEDKAKEIVEAAKVSTGNNNVHNWYASELLPRLLSLCNLLFIFRPGPFTS